MGYNRPNVTSPRVCIKTTRVVGTKEFREFKKKYPEYKGLTMAQFNVIIKQFHNNVVDMVIEEPNGVLLPERLGSLIVMSFPTKRGKVIDFGASNRAGKKVYHSNNDTDNRMCKLMFVKELNVWLNYRFWGFTPTRSFRSIVSKKYMDYWPRYLFVDAKVHVSKFLRQ